MCVHPHFIENKTRATALVSKSGSISIHSNTLTDFVKHNPLSKYKDITSRYIPVACGQCYECKTLRQSYKTQRFAMESLQSDFYFCTLTYNNEHLPVLTLCDEDGAAIFEHSVPCVQHIQNFIKRIRKRDVFGRPFKYFCASEYGGKNHRAHYHILFAVEKDTTKTVKEKQVEAVKFGKLIQQEWAINVGTRKNPIYEPLFTHKKKWQGGKLYSNYDFHFIAPLENAADDDVYYYVTKYVLKSDAHVAKIISLVRHLTEDPTRKFSFDIYSAGKKLTSLSNESYEGFYHVLEQFLKPFSLCSKHFGLPFPPSEDRPVNTIITDYIKRNIKESVRNSSSNLRSWFSLVLPQNGITVPMSPYYWKKFAEMEDFSTISENLKSSTNLLLQLGEDVPVFFTENDMSRSYIEPTAEDLQKDILRLAKLDNHISDLNRFENYTDD